MTAKLKRLLKRPPKRWKKKPPPSLAEPIKVPNLGMAIPMTNGPCERCLDLAKRGEIRMETVQRLPEGAFAPLARDGSGKCCFDCAAAENVMARFGTSFTMARIAVGNDRQEQYRMPGMPMGLVLEGIVRPSAPGDFEDQHRWLDSMNWFGLGRDEDDC